MVSRSVFIYFLRFIIYLDGFSCFSIIVINASPYLKRRSDGSCLAYSTVADLHDMCQIVHLICQFDP